MTDHVNRMPKVVVRIHQSGWTFGQLKRVWKEADKLGYDGASIYDVLLPPSLECWTTLTALTVMTEQLRPVPLVLAASYRPPALLAKMAATLDIISGGRLVLGLGAGGSEHDHIAYGYHWLPTPERVKKLEGVVSLIRAMWSGEDNLASSLPVPIQKYGPPILIGGHGENHLLRAVARSANICNIGFDLSPSEWESRKLLLARYCQEEGRDIATLGLSHNATVLIGANGEAVNDQVRRYAASKGLTFSEASLQLKNSIVGTPEQCVEQVKEYAAVGIGWVFLLFPDLPDIESIRLFGSEVLPALNID